MSEPNSHKDRTWVERNFDRALRAIIAGLAVDGVYQGYSWVKRASKENNERAGREK